MDTPESAPKEVHPEVVELQLLELLEVEMRQGVQMLILQRIHLVLWFRRSMALVA